jgi:hypothetical protein
MTDTTAIDPTHPTGTTGQAVPTSEISTDTVAKNAGRPWRNVGRAAVTVAFDSAVVGIGACVLWLTGGSTVVDGSPLGLLVCLIVCAALTVLRGWVDSAVGTRQRHLLQDGLVAVFQLTALALFVTWWQLSGTYFLGWLATFTSIYLTVLGVTIAAGRARRRGSRWPSYMVPFLAGIAGIVLTQPVWSWPVLIGVTAVVITFTAVGTVFGVWVRALRASDLD